MADLFPLDAAIPLVEVSQDGKTQGLGTYNFRERWNDLTQRLQNAPYLAGAPVSLAAQNASISATPLVSAVLPAGLYRVSWYARITTVAGVSSSLAVTIGWTEGAVSLALSGAALTGNTTTTVQSGMVLLNIDNNTPITYATTYASNAAGVMKYELVMTVERVA